MYTLSVIHDQGDWDSDNSGRRVNPAKSCVLGSGGGWVEPREEAKKITWNPGWIRDTPVLFLAEKYSKGTKYSLAILPRRTTNSFPTVIRCQPFANIFCHSFPSMASAEADLSIFKGAHRGGYPTQKCSGDVAIPNRTKWQTKLLRFAIGLRRLCQLNASKGK
jgi:hypothetical protein